MIQHRTARRIASEWHGGGGSALYALSSTGAIDTAWTGHDAELEVLRCLDGDEFTAALLVGMPRTRERENLHNLLAYVRHYGPRAAVAGWYGMYVIR